MRLSLRARLYLGHAIVAAGALIVFVVVATQQQRRWLVRSSQASLERVAILTAHDLAHDLASPPGHRLPGDPVGTSVNEPDWSAVAKALGASIGHRLTLIARDGGVLGDSEVPAGRLGAQENHADRPEVRDALQGRTGRAARRNTSRGDEFIYVAVPASIFSVAVLRLAEPTREIDALNASLLRISMLTAAVALIIALLGSFWMTHLQAARVEELRAVADRVGAGDFSARALEQPADEFGRLGRAVNQMAEDLQGRMTALQNSLHQRNQIIANFNDGVALVDPAGRFLQSNERLAILLGVPAVAPIGAAFQEYARVPQLFDLIRSARTSGRTAEVEMRFWTPPHRFVRATATPIGAGDGASVLLVLHDMTEVEQLNRVRQDFVANVSHELRTPLTSLRGYAETLLDGGLDDEQNRERFVRTIRDQATRLSALVADLLSLAELESRGASLRAVKFDLREMLEEQVGLFQPQADSAGLELVLESGEPVRVTADRIRIEQVMTNLLDNATKYTERGEVRVRLGAVNGTAWCEVVDTGPGIPEEDRSRIFERFYRVDKARRREKGGTGLGLSIVKHIVALHGGQLTVQSEPSRGSTFRFEIPLDAGAAANRAGASS